MEAFTIRCGPDGKDVHVSNSQAEQIASKCDYFKHVFAHGTSECEERVLLKPDWTIETTEALVQLITMGKTELQDKRSFELLTIAADQVLVKFNIAIPSFVKPGKFTKEHTLSSERLHEIAWAQNLSGATISLEMNAELLTCDSWLDLTRNKIAIHKEKSYLEAILPQPKLDPLQSALFLVELELGNIQWGIGIGAASRFIVKADSQYTPGSVIHKVCEIIHNHSDNGYGSQNKVFTTSAFSLRVPCGPMLRFGKVHEQISGATGAKIYFHNGTSLGYYLDGSNDGCPTISGTTVQIRNALNMLPEGILETYSCRLSASQQECKRCSLRIEAPQPRTLDSLCTALQVCRDNPNTIGVDFGTKAFFAVKTVRDMKLLLEALTAGSSALANSEQDGSEKPAITLVGLSYPKGVF